MRRRPSLPPLGRRALADLTVDCEGAFKVLAPQAVAETVDGLERAGFAELPALRSDVRAIIDSRVSPSRFVRGVERVMEWQVAWNGVDPLLTRLYNGGVFLLFTRTAQAVIAATVLIGLLVFIMCLGQVGAALYRAARPGVILPVLLGFCLTVALDELGHAFTAKAFGRDIERIGFGWYWLTPIFFRPMAQGRGEPRRRIRLASLASLIGSSSLPATASISKLLNMQLGAWTTQS